MTTSSRLQGYPDPGPGLRLHLNENTGGCSPKVLEAIRRVDPRDVSTYPSYPELIRACAGNEAGHRFGGIPVIGEDRLVASREVLRLA